MEEMIAVDKNEEFGCRTLNSHRNVEMRKETLTASAADKHEECMGAQEWEGSMEESSEKRRERLRAMREEAMAANNRDEELENCRGVGGGDGGGFGTPTLSLHSGEQQQLVSASSPGRFEYYTDPLSAFSGSQRKKIRGTPSPSSRSFGGNLVAHQAARPSFSTPQQPPLPLWQPNFHSAVTPPQSFNTPSPGYDSGSGFRSPHPSPASHSYHRSGFHSSSLSNHSPVTSPAQSFAGSEIHDNDLKAKSYGNSPGVRGSFWAGSNRSTGGKGSPGVNRDNRGLGRSGSKNYQRPFKTENVSARERPDLFVKKSMVIDPWKDLVPVRLDGAALWMDNSAEPSTAEGWLPKSIHASKPKPAGLNISPASSGPSLAESLAASLADAVTGYD